ncbi:TraB/GumN family protein [Devosia soli]|uniref:TraB/GumN family protein n=1 Tax=Devosia soli TaxID=361041 RepID=UPI000AA4A913|nr:TraB/GumN family protein [Devosia soli]
MHCRRSLLALAILLAFSNAATAAPAIWKVSDEDSSIWLFGSIHMLPADTDWRTETLDRLIQDADRVYFETDLGPEAHAEIVTLTMSRGFASDGVLLNRRIGTKLMGKVRTAAEKYDLPVPSLLAMQPWMAAMTIATAAVSGLGYDPTKGVEAVLTAEIPRDKQGFLETAAQQIEAIAGGSEADQIQMLTATIAEAQWSAGRIEDMKNAWIAGTPETVGDIFLADMGAYGDAFMDRLIVQRNKNWAQQITEMLDQDEAAVLVVGAGHLIGDYSVVTLLEEKGFTGERVQ